MKRMIAVLMAAMLLLTGCTADADKMYIAPAKLSANEESIAKLLGADRDQLLLDFKLDQNVQTLQVMAYELRDGAWERISGGGALLLDEPEGRMALGFDIIPDGMRVAIQAGERSHSSLATSAEKLDTSDMGWSTSRISSERAVEYEKEIPVACQIITAKREVRSFDADYFNDPSVFTEHGYEHVYCVTVMFSTQPME